MGASAPVKYHYSYCFFTYSMKRGWIYVQLLVLRSLAGRPGAKILIALGAGLVVGGVLGVLFAPDKGSETRRKIANAPKDFADKIKSKIKIGKEKVEDVLKRVNEEEPEMV